MKKKKIFFIIVLILFVLYVLNYSYGKLLWKNALHFPDNERAVVTVKYYADNGSSLELDEEKKDILFDLIKKEAQFAGYSSQGKLSPIMEEDDVYSVIITGDDYFSLLYLSKNPEKTVICVNNRYIKLGTMRQTKFFCKSFLIDSAYKVIRRPVWMPDIFCATGSEGDSRACTGGHPTVALTVNFRLVCRRGKE